MKILTIRLEDEDEARIEAIKKRNVDHTCITINGAIRYALKLVEEFTDLHAQLIDLFTPSWQVDQKKLQELNKKYGFLQTKFDFLMPKSSPFDTKKKS